MPRPRPFSSLGNPELVKQLFDAAFASNAARFEDVLFEIEGGDTDLTGRLHSGRGNLENIRAPLIEAAKRVFEMET
jgi:hypothetical protein